MALGFPTCPPDAADASRLYGVDANGCTVLLERIEGGAVGSRHFSTRRACYLEIGPRAREFKIPRIDDALLERIAVDARNPHYTTDGTSLLSHDGTVLVRCLGRARDYRVPEAVTRIADEAFAYNTLMRSIELPEGLLEIGQRAFVSTKLKSIVLPDSLLRVGADAFARCRDLRSVELGRGLEELGGGAFSDCDALERVRIPASLRYFGKGVFRNCNLRARSDALVIEIDPANPRYLIDAHGVLYRAGERGLTLIEALRTMPAEYAIRPGTVRIEDGAFEGSLQLERVDIPAGVVHIGDAAFCKCVNLAQADLPETLVHLGAEAFFHTALEHVRIPAGLEHLGPMALISGEHALLGTPNLGMSAFRVSLGARGGQGVRAAAAAAACLTRPRTSITVQENPRFSLESGFLCEALDGGGVRAVQYVENEPVVRVPRKADAICAYALCGTERTRELHLHDSLAEVDAHGIVMPYPLERLVVERARGNAIELFPALNSFGTYAQNQLCSGGRLDIARLADACDTSLERMQECAEKTRRMLARLANAQFLAKSSREAFRAAVAARLDDAVDRLARTADLDGLRALVELGFIDAGNIMRMLAIANAAHGTAATHFLLEAKRLHFSRAAGADDLEL